MFKQGPVPLERGPIPEIRRPWEKIVACIRDTHDWSGDPVAIIEKPLWQFNAEEIDQLDADLIYIPHREHHEFPISNGRARYYMQTVIPHMFSIDGKGWGAGQSQYPLNLWKAAPLSLARERVWEHFQERIKNNVSKFDQPNHHVVLPENYIFFPCQLPHDHTIKYHSNVSVEDALRTTLWAAREVGRGVIVKGHPVNPGSMINLRGITAQFAGTALWVEDVSIHQLISGAEAVVCVNSGVGFESLLHLKPTITFGRADYDCVTSHATTKRDQMIELLEKPSINIEHVKNFVYNWYQNHYNVNAIATFEKLEGIEGYVGTTSGS